MHHAPGPWTVEVDHATGAAEFVRAHLDGESFDVASVLCDETGNANENARLIAAAPDLLAALEMIREAASGHVPLVNSWVLSVTRAAINKALGE